MLASCVSTMITLYARTKNWELDEVGVEVVYDSDSTPRHMDVRVYLPEGLSTDQVHRLRKVADTCPARRALETGFTFNEQLIVAAPPTRTRTRKSS
jgi:putative redox protein